MTTSTAPPPPSAPPLTMACMDIWGGNRPVENGLSARGVDLWLVSRPYHEEAAGGDIHYVSSCAGGNRLRFILADVAGHGEEVDATAVDLRRLMRRYINRSDQTKLAHELNGAFADASEEGTFATAVVATYLADHRALIVCNAGHPRPFVFRRQTGRWGVVDDEAVERSSAVGVSDLPLGVLEPTSYTQLALALERDDLVVFYTDSLIEARDAGSGQMLGEAGLLDVLNGLDTGERSTLVPRLIDAVRGRAGGAEFDDDVTAMLLHHTENALPPQSWGDRARALARLVGVLRT